MTVLDEIYAWYCGAPADFSVRNGRIYIEPSVSTLQSVAEDVEYEDVSESECEMIETTNNEQK